MACDDAVLYATRQEGKDYAATILRVAELSGGEVPAGAGFLGMLEMAGNLLQRMRSAADMTRPRRAGLRSLAAIAIVALLFMPADPVSGQAAAPQQPAAAPQTTAAPQQPALDPSVEIEKEIQQHYSKAAPEVQEYVRWTAKNFGRAEMWRPAGYFNNLSPEEREKKVQYMVEALNGEYGRHLTQVLADAGAIKDKRLIPGLTKVATYHRENGDYDCRPKWMAVAALGRQDDESAVPALVDLVDHGN